MLRDKEKDKETETEEEPREREREREREKERERKREREREGGKKGETYELDKSGRQGEWGDSYTQADHYTSQ